jgi:Integrase core domain
MKSVDTIARVRREHFIRHRSIREISRDLNLSRNTVRKILRSGATEFQYEREVQPLPTIGPWRKHLDRLLMANEGKATRERLTLIHSDQGSQFNSIDWAAFLKLHNLEHSMSRRGNCHDNAVAESFFNLLKRERVRRKTYKTRDETRQDIFDYIEMFYNPQRKHVRNGMLSPINFEKQQELNSQSV